MNLQGKICVRGIFYCMTLVALLFILVAPYLESKREESETLLAYLVDSGEIDMEMAELLHVNCKLEFLHANRVLQDLELQFTEDRSSHDGELCIGRISRTKKHEIIKVLHPVVEQLILDCLSENSHLFHTTGEEKDSETLYTKSLGHLFTQTSSFQRRKLAQTFGEAPAPSPMGLFPSPAPSIPATADPQPPQSPPLPFFPPDFSGSDLQPTTSEHSYADASDAQSSKHKTSNRTVVVAVVVTAFVTFFIAAMFFLCCRKCGAGSRRGRNDERPLLSLSLSDYSIASSHKSYGLGTSTNEEKVGNQSINNKLNHNKFSGKSYIESHSLSNSKFENSVGVTTTNTGEDSVRMALCTPGLPPLKPPPGRTDPPKPPLDKAAPSTPTPTPTAPVPPPAPPIIQQFGGPRAPPPATPPPPPLPSGIKSGPRPPPPPGAGVPPPRPPPPRAGVPPRSPSMGLKPPRPVLGHPSTSTSADDGDDGPNKAKLKPFFWDKVLANPDHSMVWHQIKSGSFQFNEEMIESLFGYAPAAKNMNGGKKESASQDPSTQYIQLIDPKRSQNLSILLKALNVTTEEVCDAIEEGNELPAELIQTLIKMAPTTEEELKLRLYSGNLSQLGTAERFLKTLVEIPFAFKRLESLLFMCTLQEEISMLKESFTVLEAASTELRKSRLFLKLLEAVLKTGNRMNVGTFRGGAQAFKLDTLLKLADVKGTDGKTTLLHFVVQEIIRSEGIRAARAAKESRSLSSFKSDDFLEDSIQDSDDQFQRKGLQVVSGLGSELEDVKKAAVLDADSVTGTVSRLGHTLIKSKNFLNSEMKNVSEENGFHQALKSFVQNAEADIMWLLEEEKRVMALVKSTSDYFHGNAGKDEGLRLFIIVRDFLIILEKVCKELQMAPPKSSQTSKKDDSAAGPVDPRQPPTTDPRQRLFPAITDRRVDSSSSDDES
ncbi:formin-like protein 5 [Primulina huaijiensis]|uniref:formin-like protein 5 n=1 Tax=Primulina huaijiensis TaxID=1492673 RepID=UPI003CC75BC3